MKQVLFLAAFLSSSAVMAQSPGIVWEKTYSPFSRFYAICAMQDGTYLAAGSGSSGEFCRIDGSGNVLGTADIPIPATYIYAVEQLADGGAIATGFANSDYELVLTRLDSSCNILWTKTYDWEGTDEVGRDVEPLADGGFAVCGYRQMAGLQFQIWVLRTDSSGDTLWTKTLGEGLNDYAFGLEDSPQGLIVACTARLGSPSRYGVLATYGLDGSLLDLFTYSQIPGNYGLCDLCHGPAGGYAFITQYFYFDTIIAGIDASFSYLWQNDTPEDAYNRSWRVRPTMDSGYIIARQNDYVDDPDPPYTQDDWNAALSRYDADGVRLWSLSLERPDSCFFHDVLQLSTGGYLAAGRMRIPGNAGYIVRFAPETGIEQPPLPSALTLESCVPNPGATMFDLSWYSSIPGATAVRIYDVSGRLRLDEDLGLTAEGEHTTQLDMQELPSGCYLVVVSCGTERASTKLVLLR
jgi:hypothetical protein